MIESTELVTRLDLVREAIAAACRRAGRRPEEVRLIGATKSVPAADIRAAAAAGLTEFGENFVQELMAKRAAAPQATWHYIGRLQSRKVGRILEAADVIQTLEPGRSAERLGRRAADRDRPVDCLVEIDFTAARVGVPPDDAEGFLESLSGSAGIAVRGLMAVPPLGGEPRPYFARLRELRNRLAERFPEVRELSMGMSADYEEAVEEGATMVRVGSAIFGHRPKP